MEEKETPHLVTHFMAAGAEKRLEDYHFLRNTYETITQQEIQLNRILRMLGEDEYSLTWRLDLPPIGRARSRSPMDFDRWNNLLTLQGSIAYERLRELEQENSKNKGPPTIPSSTRRVQELRERRQRLSEQREYSSGSTSGGGAPSSSRLRALTEYDTALAESEAKRKRQAEENRLNILKNKEEEEVTERRHEKFKTLFDDENQNFKDNFDMKLKQQEDESSNRLTKKVRLNEEKENNFDKIRKSSIEYDHDKTGDIELIAFTVRCQPISSSNKEQDEDNFSVRLLCQWASPSSSSAIKYFTIERQLSDNEWLPIGEKIDKLANKTQLDISSSDYTELNANIPSYFRLKAHCQNGQTFTSKPTDGIFINLYQEKNIIIPDVEVLSPSSVQLTWNDNKIEDIKGEENKNGYNKTEDIKSEENKNGYNKTEDNENEDIKNGDIENEDIENEDIENEDIKNEDIKNEDIKNEDIKNEDVEKKDIKKKDIKPEDFKKEDIKTEDFKYEEKPNMYDIEKKEEEQAEWEKVMEVPLSQRSARIDSLTDASQCQFRLIPSAPESEEAKKSEKKVEPEKSTKAEKAAEPEEATKSEEEVKPKESKKAEKKVEPEKTTKAEKAAEPEEATKSEDEVKPKESKKSEKEVEPEKPTKAENEIEPEVLTVNNVNELLNSLHIEPTSPTTVNVDISEEGFKEFDSYKIEYTTADRLDQWKQVSDITRDDPHLAIDKLKQGTDYKFRFTPSSSDTTTNETNSSQLSLILDVKMPSTRKGRLSKDESETPVSTPPQFSIQKLDPTSVLIEAVVPEEEPATFEDVYDVFSKKETIDDDWTKVGTIDNEHLSTTVENLEENTAYAFKIANTTSPSADDESNTIQEFKYDTTPVKQYDPSLFLEKIEQSLENVVNGVMQAAAGHQAIEEPVNKSLNEVIKEVFRDETLVPNEEYGFETLQLNNDLQLYRGPKQMMLKELEVDETIDVSNHYGEIIIHNYRTSQQSVVVREENGNTRVGNIDGDVIIRNVVSDVLLKNEKTNLQLSMNIVGQAFLRGVQGTIIASKFKGIIVVKNVNKP